VSTVEAPILAAFLSGDASRDADVVDAIWREGLMTARAWAPFVAPSVIRAVPYLFIKVALDDGIPADDLATAGRVLVAVTAAADVELGTPPTTASFRMSTLAPVRCAAGTSRRDFEADRAHGRGDELV
jgi:hypothetical protein